MLEFLFCFVCWYMVGDKAFWEEYWVDGVEEVSISSGCAGWAVGEGGLGMRWVWICMCV